VTTPQQFLESFLQEKASVYADSNVHLSPLYTRYFGEPLSQRARDFMLPDKVEDVIEDVKQTAGSASAITRRHFRTADIRTRYHLVLVGKTWKIVRIDRERFRCHGTGQSGGSRCQKCDGEGWHDSTSNAA
jgi:DnaJ-class molecular chaperone